MYQQLFRAFIPVMLIAAPITLAEVEVDLHSVVSLECETVRYPRDPDSEPGPSRQDRTYRFGYSDSTKSEMFFSGLLPNLSSLNACNLRHWENTMHPSLQRHLEFRVFDKGHDVSQSAFALQALILLPKSSE
jgi:hypothetical protein